MGCPKTAPELINQLCSLHYLPSETGHCCKYFKVCNQHFERWMKEEPEAQRIHNEWLRLSNPEYCEKCGYIVSQCECEKPMTNADRIRAMSDEELAEWLAGISHEWGDGDECIVNFNGVRVGDWKTDILDWLQSEVEQ